MVKQALLAGALFGFGAAALAQGASGEFPYGSNFPSSAPWIVPQAYGSPEYRSSKCTADEPGSYFCAFLALKYR